MCKKINEMTEDELAALIEKKLLESSSNTLNNKYFNYRELSKYTGICERKLKRLKKQEKIPYQKIGGSIRFNRKMIDMWMFHNGEKTTFTKREIKRFEKYMD